MGSSCFYQPPDNVAYVVTNQRHPPVPLRGERFLLAEAVSSPAAQVIAPAEAPGHGGVACKKQGPALMRMQDAGKRPVLSLKGQRKVSPAAIVIPANILYNYPDSTGISCWYDAPAV